MPNRRQALTGALAATTLAARGARAQASEIRISRQPGILYMPLHVIEKHRLIERHAERLGVPGASVRWLAFANGGAQQDALLAGGVDVVNTGTGQLLILWDRTRGGVKGIAATCALPLQLVSREERVRTLKDLQPGDKIALPTVKTSTQAILLQIAASELYGPDQYARFDAMTQQMGHPDAFIAMRNAGHEVRNHFGAPPFSAYELKEVPGAHLVTDSAAIIGGPLSQGQFFTTTRFADVNPKLVQAVFAAAAEAKEIVDKDLRGSVEAYREVNNDRTPTDALVAFLSQPGMQEWSLYPQGTMKVAAHLHRVGTLKRMPASWKDYYLPIAHDLGAGS